MAEAELTGVAAFQELGICIELAEAAVALGWKAPTEIQKQAIPQTLAGVFLQSVREMFCLMFTSRFVF